MPSAPDPRRTPGCCVYAKARDVTSLAEAKRRYGRLADSKLVPGVVVSAQFRPGEKRGSWCITADYELQGAPMKRKELNSRSVHAGEIPDTPVTHSATPRSTGRQPAVATNRSGEQDGQPLPVAYSDPAQQEPLPNIPTATTTALLISESDCHGIKWEEGEANRPVGGGVTFRPWSFTTVTGEKLGADADMEGRSPFFYFMAMFPPKQLNLIVKETNTNLIRASLPPTSKGEILQFFGVMMLITRFEFGSRASLWSRKRPGKYIPAPQIGDTGMARGRYDQLWRHIRFSAQPLTRPNGVSSEIYRWSLVQNFVDNYNQHRQQLFTPSDLICVDESMSKWYGMGGFWINEGLPQYIAIDRKPENGCEIQNAACGRSGVMLKLKLVKTAETENQSAEEGPDGLNHGCVVLKELVHPWAMSNRIVCADSYFASVQSAQELKKMGLRFIGVVKTATKGFRMKVLSEKELAVRGDRYGLVSLDAEKHTSLLAFVWMDRDRRYFISSCSSLRAGTPYDRRRWRQLQHVSTNSLPQLVHLSVPQPEASEIYYSCCGMIDRHNRCRQDDLKLEHKLGTLDWSMRVNCSILGMLIVDSWLVYKACRGARLDMTQAEFYTALSEDLIDNNHDIGFATRKRVSACESAAMEEGVPCCGIGPHLTPTKRRRKNSPAKLQGNCKICSKKTTHVCSECRQNGENSREEWLCHSKSGASCFAQHMASLHRL